MSDRSPIRRLHLPLVLLLSAMLLLPAPASAQLPGGDGPNVLVWTGTYGFRHPSITSAQLAIGQMAAAGNFSATITENPAMLTAAVLRDYDVLMWVSTTGKPPLTAQQRADVVRFAGCGGGNIGFHAALDSNYGWQEHAEIFGAQFDSHPQNAGAGAANMQVEDQEHPITEGWHDVESFPFDDEYYRWRSAKGVEGVSLPREYTDTQVLLSLDETSVAEGIQEGPTPYEDDQPIAWIKTFRDRGRVYYNNMGHSDGTWTLPEFQTALVNGVSWVAEVPLDLECMDGDDELPPAPAVPEADPAVALADCTLPDLLLRENGTWESSGEAKFLTPDGDTMPLSAGIAGGLGWGAQTYILDLTGTGAATADVTFTLQIPNPADDYDLSVTTPWGFFGSTLPQGATEEVVTIEGVPNCGYMHVAGDNLAASSTRGPTLVSTVTPGPAVELDPLDTIVRITGSGDGPAAVAASWAAINGAPACGCALLARDDDFADALASGAAQASGATLLLTDGSSLSDPTVSAIRELAITQVTILGGEQAIEPAVEQALADMDVTVARVAGDTRITTSIAVADAFSQTLTGIPLIVRAYGTPGDQTAAFADALAAGRTAATGAHPILLTTSDGVSPEVLDHLTAEGVTEVFIVGGEAAVGPQVAQDLQDAGIAVTRVAGPTRHETAVAVATQIAGVPDAAAAGGVLLVDGAELQTWADGFAAAAWAGDGVVVLADGASLPAATTEWIGAPAGQVPLTCGAGVSTAACDAAGQLLGHDS